MGVTGETPAIALIPSFVAFHSFYCLIWFIFNDNFLLKNKSSLHLGHDPDHHNHDHDHHHHHHDHDHTDQST